MTTRSAALVAALQRACGDKLAEVKVALDEVTIVVTPEQLLATATTLRDAPELRFEQLIDLCGVDYREYGGGGSSGPRFAVVYQPVTIEPREIVPRVIREENYADVDVDVGKKQ